MIDDVSSTLTPSSLLDELRAHTACLDRTGELPRQQFRQLAEAGVLGWVIPEHFGGSPVSEAELTAGYAQLAAACLTTTFVLTQRNGACQRIAGSDNDDLKSRLLPGLAGGELFATVGISHLTTSRQHLGKPAVTADEVDGGFRLSGTIPWVTGATMADIIVCGATCSDGRQLLAAMSTDSDGVEIGTPARMLALNASQTGAVHLNSVFVAAEDIIAGPIAEVMKQGTGGGTGGLTTSALAIGAAHGSIAGLQDEAARRPDLEPTFEKLTADYEDAHRRLMIAAVGGTSTAGCNSEDVRRIANSLVTRSAQAYLAASKGAGFVSGHPAEQAVRESMFFYVWSCPQPVLAAALAELSCGFGDVAP